MDAVTAFETIYFWPDIRKSFSEVARVLKAGGGFMVIQDSTDPEGKPWTEYIGKMKIYTPEEIASLMSEAGFSRTEIRKTNTERVAVIGLK